MAQSPTARPRRSRYVARVVDWMGIGALASTAVALLELGFIAATLPSAASDLSGLAVAFLHVCALFWVYSLVIAIALGTVGRATVKRRANRSAPVVLTVIYAAAVVPLLRVVDVVFSLEHWEFPAEMAALRWWSVFVVVALALVVRRPVARAAARIGRYAPRRLLRYAAASMLGFGAVATVAVAHLDVAPVYLVVLRVPMGVAALVLAMLALGGTVQRQSLRTSLGVTAAVGVFGLAVFVPGPLRDRARYLVYDQGAVSSGMAELLRDVVDVDHDGSAPRWLGGTDCAEGNRSRGPMLREIPGDGIDQDCRGGDASPQAPLGPPALPPDCTPLPGRQNLLLVTVDALRADAFRLAVMPTLVELARHSVVFGRAYAPTAMTATSLVALFAGRPLSDLGVSNPLKDDRLTASMIWTERLKAAGYRTAAFDLFEVPDLARRGFEHHNDPLIDESPMGVKNDLTSGRLSTAALAFIERSTDTPFFVWLHYSDVHAAYKIDHDANGVLSERAAYERDATYVDRHLAGLLTELQSKGLFQNTIIAVSADHGEELMDRGREGHGANVFEESIHVPLVLWAPGCRPRGVDQPVSLTELGPTLGSLLGVPIPGLGLFSPRSLPVVSEAVVGFDTFYKRAVVGARYKLIVDVNNGGRLLFDLAKDPDELQDLSADDPRALELMEGEYQRWLDSAGAR